MSIEMNHAEKQVYGLLKYLHDTNNNLKISQTTLRLLVLSTVAAAVQEMIDVENPDMDKAREASRIDLESVLTKSASSGVASGEAITITDLRIPDSVEPLSEKAVLRILTSGISMEKARTCTKADTDKDVVLIFWRLWESLCKKISDIVSEVHSILSKEGECEVPELQRIRDLKKDCEECTAQAPIRIAELS